MQKTILLLALVLIYGGCRNKGTFFIEGAVKKGTGEYIHISRVDVDITIPIDSAKINRKGIFKLKVSIDEPGFYQLGFSSSDFIRLLASPEERIHIIFHENNLAENYTITGSEGSEKIAELDFALYNTKRKLDSLKTLYETVPDITESDKQKDSLETEFYRLIRDQRKKNIEFIINNINSLASIKALYQKIDEETYVLYDPRDIQYLKIVTDSLSKKYPDLKNVKALKGHLKREMNEMYINQIKRATREMPQTQIDPILKNTEGKRVAMSSCSGEYVLLSFWSYKSDDCIAENLRMKELYKIYHKKGFEIYQINLDTDKEEWRYAVKFDELPWISTREDDPLNPKYSVIFNVKSLPTNYLIDRNGEIIASGLHGKSLKLKLEQIFN